jgi:hypothetical protein
MENSLRSRTLRDHVSRGRPGGVREADRSGKTGDAAKSMPFIIRPKAMTIEIRAGIVAVKARV